MRHHTIRTRLFIRRLPGHTVIAIHGELDISTAPELRDRTLPLLRGLRTPVIIDLSGVSFCDASGLALLVGTRRRAALHGITVALAGPRPNVSKLLRITGLDRVFVIHPTLAAAQLDRTPGDQRTAA